MTSAVLLEPMQNGAPTCQFVPPASTSEAAETASPGAAGGPAAQISIDNFTIENGTVLYRAGGTEQKLEGLGAVVVMRSLTGPFTATGDAKIAGMPTKFDLTVDSLAGGGAIPMRATIYIAGDAAVLSFDGSADQAAALVKGKIAAKLNDPPLILKSAVITGPPPNLSQAPRQLAALASTPGRLPLCH